MTESSLISSRQRFVQMVNLDTGEKINVAFRGTPRVSNPSYERQDCPYWREYPPQAVWLYFREGVLLLLIAVKQLPEQFRQSERPYAIWPRIVSFNDGNHLHDVIFTDGTKMTAGLDSFFIYFPRLATILPTTPMRYVVRPGRHNS